MQPPTDACKVSNHPVSSTLTIVATIAEQATRAVAVVTVCLREGKGAGSAQAVTSTIACQQVDKDSGIIPNMGLLRGCKW